MVARLLRLRLTLLGAAFRGPLALFARTLYVGALAVAAAAALAWVPRWLVADLADRGLIDTVLVSIVLAGAAVVPLFANRGHLEPRQFGAYPARPASVATGLLVSSALSWPAIWLLLWMAALIALRPEWWDVWWAIALAVVLTLVLAVSATRVASALAKLVVPPQSEGALRATGLMVLLATMPVVIFAVAQALGAPDSSMTADAAGVLGWTPLGASVMGLELAVQGDADGAMLRFGIAAAAAAVLIACWYLIVRRSVRSVEHPMSATVGSRDLGAFDRFPTRPGGAIAARALTYWRRDPRYRVALAAIPLAPVVMLVALWIAGTGLSTLALLPLPVILLLLGWSVHNDVAMDSTALWIHVASGTRGRDDRFGRLTPVLLIGLPLVLVGSSISVTVLGDWRVLPAVLGMNLAVLLSAAGVSSVWSALMPYPSTRPGDSPFAQPAVSGSGAGLAQTLSMLTALLLSAPPVVVAVLAIEEVDLGANLVALLFGTVWGVLILVLGVLIGGRVFDRRAPELLALTQTFD